MALVIIGHNKDGELRYAQTATGQGCRATGITADKAKATVFTDANEANTVFQILRDSSTWRGYAWRVREAVVKPCTEE